MEPMTLDEARKIGGNVAYVPPERRTIHMQTAETLARALAAAEAAIYAVPLPVGVSDPLAVAKAMRDACAAAVRGVVGGTDAVADLARRAEAAEAQVAALTAKLATARAALRQVRVVIDVATYDPVAAEACSSAMHTIDAVLNESDVLRIPPCHPASNTPATNLNVAAPPVENPGPVEPPGEQGDETHGRSGQPVGRAGSTPVNDGGPAWRDSGSTPEAPPFDARKAIEAGRAAVRAYDIDLFRVFDAMLAAGSAE